MRTRSACLALLLLAPAAGLRAQRPVQFGFALHGSVPVGDLDKDLDGRMGGGLSFLVPMDLGLGHVVRPRLDLNAYAISDYRRYQDEYRESQTFSSFGMAADYLFYPGGNSDRGVYFGVGLGFQRWALTNTTYDDHDHHQGREEWEITYNRTSPSFAVCLGVQANRWFAVEARFTSAQYYGHEGVLLGDEVLDQRKVTRNGSSVQVGFTFKW